MPLFNADPTPGAPTVADLLEDLGLAVHAQYAALERELVKIAQKYIAVGIDETSAVARALAVYELGEQSRAALAKVNPQTIAAEVIGVASTAGEAAAVARLGLAPRVSADLAASTVFGRQQASIINTLTTQLAGGLTSMSPTILRSVQDTYQRVVSQVVAEGVAGTLTPQQRQRRAVDLFGEQGITGYMDRAGRRWPIGTYADMATRTASNRAWQEGHIGRLSESGIHLVTIVVGPGADKACTNWSGRILSTDGRTGSIEVQHATRSETITVEVTGTLEQARAAGWNHPNCRCTVAGYFPGLKVPGGATSYDPKAEAARVRLRQLEVAKRKALADVDQAADDLSRAEAKRRVKAANARIAEHVDATGIVRQRQRESLLFSAR
jgi:hypothetical protein